MYKIEIVGPGEHDDVVAEIDCTPAFTAVVGLGEAGFFVQIFNVEAAQIEDFAYGTNVKKNSVDLDAFLDAIGRAKALLSYQTARIKSGGGC